MYQKKRPSGSSRAADGSTYRVWKCQNQFNSFNCGTRWLSSLLFDVTFFACVSLTSFLTCLMDAIYLCCLWLGLWKLRCSGWTTHTHIDVWTHPRINILSFSDKSTYIICLSITESKEVPQLTKTCRPNVTQLLDKSTKIHSSVLLCIKLSWGHFYQVIQFYVFYSITYANYPCVG